MTDYRVARQFKRFSDLDTFNYCVNIFDDGDTLSIVTDAGAHGTHVAGIVSAFHPDQPEVSQDSFFRHYIVDFFSFSFIYS